MITNYKSKSHEHCVYNLDFTPNKKGKFHEAKADYFTILKCVKNCYDDRVATQL